MAYNPSKLTLREAIDLIKELGSENPKAELVRAGEDGDITATGLIVTVFGGVPWPEISDRIPPRFWRYTINWDENLIRQTPLGNYERLNESETAREIRIERSKIEGIWGASNRSQSGRRFSGQKVTVAYKKRVEDWPNNERCPSRDDDFMWANEKFDDGVPRDFVRDLRRKYAPEYWKTSGRPKDSE